MYKTTHHFVAIVKMTMLRIFFFAITNCTQRTTGIKQKGPSLRSYTLHLNVVCKSHLTEWLVKVCDFLMMLDYYRCITVYRQIEWNYKLITPQVWINISIYHLLGPEEVHTSSIRSIRSAQYFNLIFIYECLL